MKIVKCDNCGTSIPTILNTNSRVIYFEKEENNGCVELTCKLGVYCPTCGEESGFTIKHYFSKNLSCFNELSAEHLRDIALCESGVI